MIMSHRMLPLEQLVFNEDLYPRTGIDEQHVRQFERAMEAGVSLPPIVVAKGSWIVVDGIHRMHAHLRREEKKIAATVKVYRNDAEIFHDAVLLNSGQGLKLGQDDALKVISIAERLGFKEIDVAGMLRTSIAHLRALRPRYATIADARKGVRELRRIGLKGSVRHLSGTTISAAQAAAMASAPGQSYLLNVNQLLDALRHDLLPDRDTHRTLWANLAELAALIQEKLREAA
jgi:ParB-like nuclease family protein